MTKVLLIGNDINNASRHYPWKELLKDLMVYARLEDSLSIEGKPFPLLYEEIFLNAARQYGTREKRIKAYIAAKARKLQPNKIHERIFELNIPIVLTTNYDLALERVLHERPDKIVNAGVVKENRYSLFRVNTINEHRIWHIHGIALHPLSITLGYEHYSGYLQQMRAYAVAGVIHGQRAASLVQRIKDDTVTHGSWVDYFFTHDVHIFGLSLDFVEIHLWWLLTFRARTRLQQNTKLTNKIYYYYPKKYEERARHKLQLLSANEVITIPLMIKADNRNSYYDRVIQKIKSFH